MHLNRAGEWRQWSIEDDYRAVATAVGPDWGALSGARIFITGGTGFIGGWLLECLHYAACRQGHSFEIVVLSRDSEKFRQRKPHLAGWSGLRLIAGDVTEFAIPEGAFDYVVHAATDASAALNRDAPRQMFDVILHGTRRALDLAAAKNVRRFLFLSTGAVYGQQPWDVTHVKEDWTDAPDCSNPVNAYGEAKRAAEMLCAIYAKQFGVTYTTARIFALLGPHLPLDAHFAAGNFIRDAMRGEEIVINGDGRPCRSYLYAGDLIAGLLRMLARGPAGGFYNVGSTCSVSIAELAQRIAEVVGGRYRIAGKPDQGWNAGRYAPNMQKFNDEFGAVEATGLDEAIARTALWNGWKPWQR
jgi:nucleoside-diphosphate-sugar epimerase